MRRAALVAAGIVAIAAVCWWAATSHDDAELPRAALPDSLWAAKPTAFDPQTMKYLPNPRVALTPGGVPTGLDIVFTWESDKEGQYVRLNAMESLTTVEELKMEVQGSILKEYVARYVPSECVRTVAGVDWIRLDRLPTDARDE